MVLRRSIPSSIVHLKHHTFDLMWKMGGWGSAPAPQSRGSAFLPHCASLRADLEMSGLCIDGPRTQLGLVRRRRYRQPASASVAALPQQRPPSPDGVSLGAARPAEAAGCERTARQHESRLAVVLSPREGRQGVLNRAEGRGLAATRHAVIALNYFPRLACRRPISASV